jgi:hypothetical protein
MKRGVINFGSILTTFEPSSIFGGCWGSIKNWLEPKTEPPSGNLACPNPWVSNSKCLADRMRLKAGHFKKLGNFFESISNVFEKIDHLAQYFF